MPMAAEHRCLVKADDAAIFLSQVNARCNPTNPFAKAQTTYEIGVPVVLNGATRLLTAGNATIGAGHGVGVPGCVYATDVVIVTGLIVPVLGNATKAIAYSQSIA
jgi:hypothetical protein